jgi:hypothetical protein
MSTTLLVLLSIMTSAIIIFSALFNSTFYYFTNAYPEISSSVGAKMMMMIKNPPRNQGQLSNMTTEQQQQQAITEANNNNDSTTVLRLLANIFETRINRTAALLELTSKLPEVRNVNYVGSITKQFMGIPQNLDLQKRKIARYVLEQDKDIASIFFLTPTGDIYMGEPFSDQKQLPRLNYADRDWYKGVTKINDTYVSAVFFSAAIHAPAIGIAVPVYGNDTSNDDDDNDNDGGIGHTPSTRLGYWVGIVDLNIIKEDLLGLGLLSGNNRILIVDHNATQVLDTIDINASSSSQLSSGPSYFSSSSSSKSQELESFGYLESVKDALNGEHGSIAEMINGTRVTTHYYPIHVTSHRWAVLLIKPS